MDILKKYYLPILVGILTLITIGISGLYCYDHFFKKDEVISSSQDIAYLTKEKSTKENLLKHVEIKGQVNTPGVYEVNNDTIISDVITLAGGFTDKAYTDNINLSKKVSDEMVIFVYSKDEYNSLNKPDVIYVEKPCNCPDVDISKCTEAGSSMIESNPGSSSTQDNVSTSESSQEPAVSGPVNINTASESELETLSGIGQVKAKAIIKYRSENGKFNTIQDIMKVNGISQATFDKIKDGITV